MQKELRSSAFLSSKDAFQQQMGTYIVFQATGGRSLGPAGVRLRGDPEAALPVGAPRARGASSHFRVTQRFLQRVGL